MYTLSSMKGKQEDKENVVFFLKMCGDYNRYLAEMYMDESEEFNTAKQCAMDTYNEAYKKSQEGLESTHPIRLGLALNRSVFYYEIVRDRSEACDIAKKAFDEAVANLDSLEQESYRDATLIMQLLRDNLSLWLTEDGTITDEATAAAETEDKEQTKKEGE